MSSGALCSASGARCTTPRRAIWAFFLHTKNNSNNNNNMCTPMRGNTRKFRVLHDKHKILKQVFLFKRWHLCRSVNLLLENYPHSAFLATLAMMKSSVFSPRPLCPSEQARPLMIPWRREEVGWVLKVGKLPLFTIATNMWLATAFRIWRSGALQVS